MPHAHHPGGTENRLLISLLLTTGFVIAEAVAGWWANSLALLSDAGHNFADALALGFTWFAYRMAQKPADARRTYGYHRVGILAALVNAVSLVILALFIFWEAFQRFQEPEPVQGWLMTGVAVAAVVVNGLITLWLHHEAAHDLNVRSAYLHVLGDAVSALGVVLAGGLVLLTGSTLADPVASLLIGGLILWSSWDILAEAVNVLLEAAPRGVDVVALERVLRQVPGVCDVHDLHVWSVASGIVACSCHVVVSPEDARHGQAALKAASAVLEHDFGITHSTIQVEAEGCQRGETFCSLRPTAHRH